MHKHFASWQWNSLYARALFALLFLGAILMLSLSLYWSIPPHLFNVEENANNALKGDGASQNVVGFTSTTTLISLIELLVEKPGGYINNDQFPPGVWLDNISHWEQGVLIQTRDFTRMMRRNIARAQSPSREDPYLIVADDSLNSDPKHWIFPSAEGEYQKASEALKNYRHNFFVNSGERSNFYARVEHLHDWLQEVTKRLTDLSQRLSASVSPYIDPRTNETLPKTPWSQLDDIFYEARGSTYALTHLMKSMQVDFETVLSKKNAMESMDRIIHALEASQAHMSSPVVLNGSEFGFLANHSLTLAAFISQANADIIELSQRLAE